MIKAEGGRSKAEVGRRKAEMWRRFSFLLSTFAFLLGALAGVPAAAAATPGASLDIPTPYLPSTTVAVDEMLRLANVTPGDLVVDLGSGDGRMVISAARDYGARGLGIELDARLVVESQENARKAGVTDRVTFRQGDVLASNYRDATVVTLYLLPNLVERLKPQLLELRPGTRIVTSS